MRTLVINDVKLCSNSSCRRVGIQLPLSEFYPRKTIKTGYRSRCKECEDKYRKLYEQKPETIEKKKLYRKRPDVKERTKKCAKKYRQSKKGRESAKKDKKLYYERHKEQIKQRYKTPRKRFSAYKCDAKRGNKIFEIDLDFATSIFLSNCVYCGQYPNPINGIDRVDSSLGYIKSNCTPCCCVCNQIKMDLSVEEMWNHINKMIEFKKK